MRGNKDLKMDIRTQIPTNGGGTAQKHADLWGKQIALLQSKWASGIEEVRLPSSYPTDIPILYVRRDLVTEVLRFLKTEAECDYNFLSDVTATDEGGEFRFEVVYQLFSQQKGARLRIKVRLHENETIPTASGVWPAANWAEREVWDMFGIKFEGHPDLRRILMDERWEGHPLRKDYPLRGYQIFTEPMAPKPELLD